MTYDEVEEKARCLAGTVLNNQLDVSDLDRFEAFKDLFMREQYEQWKQQNVGTTENITPQPTTNTSTQKILNAHPLGLELLETNIIEL